MCCTVYGIFRRFVSALPIADELRREVGKAVKTSPLSESSVALFDEAQLQIETLINNTTYPNFLKSDMYLHYVQVSVAFVNDIYNRCH